MKKRRSIKKILAVIAICAVVLLVGLWWAFCVVMYNENFNVRCESYEPYLLYVDDFDGLSCKDYSFTSDKGQKLAGYLYSVGDDQRGIVVLAHGFGGGHNSYMDCAYFFAKNGYYVFAYDSTGSDASEGEGVGGTPQGVIDLDHAISFVEDNEEIPDLPIVLFGHSWGAYSVCSVLSYHPEVKAVVACCGFNSSSDMFESGGKSSAGSLIYCMVPFIKIHEFVKYGDYATNTAIDGFKTSDAAVMIVHSADDDVIGIEYGYDKYYSLYKNDPRFKFIRFEDRGHNDIFIDPENTYYAELHEEFDKWMETLDYDPKAEENDARFKKDTANYLKEHIDHDKWSYRIDEELFDQFLEFYDQAIL